MRMRRAVLGVDVLGQERRNEILRSIAAARGIAAEVDARIATLPAWALGPGSPLGQDRDRLVAAAEVRRSTQPVVAAVEARLAAPGPVWPGLTEAESQALQAWIGAISDQGDALDRYFMTRTEKDVMLVALLALGVGALFAPLLWTRDENGRRPRLSPPRPMPTTPPSRFAPVRRPAAFRPFPAPSTPEAAADIPIPAAVAPPLRPIREVRVPAPAGAPSPLREMRVPLAPPPPAAPARPSVPELSPAPPRSEPSPFRGIGPAAPPIEVSPGVFRSSAPPMARPTGRPGPHMPVYPRYQRTGA